MLVFGVQSGASGGSFRSGFMSGIVSSGVSSLVGYVAISLHFNASQTAASMIFAGGLSGGISSHMSGGSFLDGVKQGLMTSSLNHALHTGAEGIAGALEDPPPHSCRYEGQYHEDETGIYYNDGEKWVRVEMQLNTASITAEGKSIGVAAVGFGLSATGVFGVGPQSGVDVMWITAGHDASFWPKFVAIGGGGTGYNIDVDFHAGATFYYGFKSDLTAENIFNTNVGYAGSFSASAVGSVGFNGSYSTASPSTHLFGGTGSLGLSLIPGVNWYFGAYTSKKF